MPKLTESQKKSRIRKIHDAAYRCIAENGYANTSIRDISEQAGISLGGLYVYFDSKEEIIRSMVKEGEHYKQEIINEIKQLDEGLADPASLVKAFVQKFSGPDGTDGIRADISIWEAAFQNEKLYEIRRESFNDFIDYCSGLISEAQQKGQIQREIQPQALAHIILSLIQGFGIQKTFDIEIDSTQYMDVIDFIMNSLSGK